ncbi:transmembrane amino acid transporter protein-domain-containing protein [Yarrowia lipolytica]|uniref:YALI0E00308p n=2 Tax=Yarrowia lipolytica TaxID=4952 RepID=Q6C7J4_YARLI|nr:YALI0E00308p [Yarrowia lipolytica CLIB122]AOW04755.1 hypothetical protein YALI1_E00628g [Yarrowia lipolytica]KAB8282810.1 transmembrane amino acid transporter protein-domain-containing protein [Yarrowia lipolytica]KAE8169245.1 transmembrane amino acid transporter protein-domain-containing protein [Yarrowia lipolytica]KAJ8056340.1 transmembrane amino acid transporter protein-domain-containing protein [Yarrowia lipolytica]QNP98693.1 Lysine histidine transporter 1 [Yarrowia lipolytica]|eukprot:XP_503368.1 YALI0E00308p [Yarrowia lipolytica CLIB122]
MPQKNTDHSEVEELQGNVEEVQYDVPELHIPTTNELLDSTEPFQIYYHYAAMQRAREDALPGSRFRSIFSKYTRKTDEKQSESDPCYDTPSDDGTGVSDVDPEKHAAQSSGGIISQIPGASQELAIANMSARTATWMSVFFLTTTDILGPSSAPWAISQLGWFPGVMLFTVLGVAAVYTGWLIYKMFLKLDSPEFPMKTFGDLALRVYGKGFRWGVDILQSLQLLCNVAVIILGNGQGLSQIYSPLCFSVWCIIFMVAGILLGQIKRLSNFSYVANAAIWMNLFVVFATMGIAATKPPNYVGGAQQNNLPNSTDPVRTKAIEEYAFQDQLGAVMNIVYSYGGAMVFVEFLSEMRKPREFLKGMLSAQGVIFVCYLLYGLLVYAYQGQYTVNPGNQGLGSHNWQIAVNVISVVSSLIAAGLYGNVGIKVVYITLIRRAIPALPGLDDGIKGRIAWALMVFIYWAVAFVIASAIPQFSSLTSLVGAACILQFSYTFPPFMYMGLTIREEASKLDTVDLETRTVIKYDSWRSMARWKRGIMSRPWWVLVNFVLFLASLATAILGIYSSIYSLVEAFDAPGAATVSFGCKPPVA